VGEVGPITQSCFAIKIRGLLKLLSCNKDKPLRREEIKQVLTAEDVNLAYW